MQRGTIRCAVALAIASATFMGCGDDDDDDARPDARPGAGADAAATVDAMPSGDAGDDADASNAALDAAVPDAALPDAALPDAAPMFLVEISTSPGGSVTAAPGSIDCPGSCSERFVDGTSLTLTAAPDADFAFEGWSGDCRGELNPLELTVDRPLSCAASFVGASGDGTIVDPPVSVVPNVTEDQDSILIFVERRDLLLVEPLTYDSHVPTTLVEAPISSGLIPADTRVNVYFVHFDPESRTAKRATITFPQPIVGLILTAANLDASDISLGRDDVDYPAPGTAAQRDLELGSEDQLSLAADRRSITLDLQTSTVADQVRVITLADGEVMPALRTTSLMEVAPPASVARNAAEAAGVLLFDEASVVLARPLAIDAATPGRYASAGSIPGGSIPAGTAVRSVMLHFDPTGSGQAEASVDLGAPILGIALDAATLDASDGVIGNPSTVYPTGADADRRVELGTDRVTIGDDGQTILFRASATTAADQLRVLLAP